MITTKEAIRKTETKIEGALNDLEESHGIRAFRMQVISERGQTAEITITPDDKGRALLMSFDLTSIKKGVEHKAPRMILLGVEKIGKSTFAAGADNPIFLPIKGEEGVDDLDVAKFPPAETFDDVLAAVTTLIKDEHEYKTFIIDSVSALEPVIWAKLCEEDGVEKH